ncbi:transglutaminase domain-containing protein [Geothrix sp. 21YS21S-4]|uniref:transglutaminase family protein n=1 Tax=Geothrix sp. 21YS21S-4 TaxID=3068889 RepID=UPI0027B97CB6|nr:transglutaminase domain-containing protein [Geothrix sp. 21YS21S-4]
MKAARWIDHLPLWVVLGAAASTGTYDPGELVAMALPLAAAVGVELLRWDLGRRQRWLEAGAVVFFLADLSRGRGIFAVAIHTLFLLAGMRLALPRELPQRRQLVLIGFLLLLTAAVSTTDLIFLVWALAWAGAAAAALLQQTWEASAALRRGAPSRAPYARVPLWLGASVLLGAAFFLLLPRLNAGFRPPFLRVAGALAQAGLGDQLDLGANGPIAPNSEVVLRIVPPPEWNPTDSRGLELLRGVALEALDGDRWTTSDLTPSTAFMPPARHASAFRVEFLFSPSGQGILALPYGLSEVAPPGLPLRRAEGGSLRWRFPRARPMPVEVAWNPSDADPGEGELSSRRRQLLLQPGPEEAAIRRWSLRVAPGILPAPQLARTLERALRGFRYTLDNPSGGTERPLEDFLERTQAGHCEYFASAMALMMRTRGVPARVVNGYRLGPWIPEGGYFRVSQDQAHSWVEYWDQGRWRRADPTPAGPPGAKDAGFLAALSRWADTLNYRWDRYVVRFSDEDQQAGLSWIQSAAQAWEWRWKAPPAGLSWSVGTLALAWIGWRSRALWRPTPSGPGSIRALRPLLARLRRQAPPISGETARAWLERLGALRPERAEALLRLAEAVEAQIYGEKASMEASALAKAEASAWRGWKASTSR